MRADLALVGFGNVGRRFAALLAEQRPHLLDAYDLDCRVVGIATARHGAACAPDGIDLPRAVRAVEDAAGGGLASAAGHAAVTTPADVIAALSRSSASLRVVVETTTLSIADGQPAIAHMDASLDAGCHAITANKGPAAFAYARLRDKARAAGLSFLFEGAVMDGIPIFNLARETMPAVTVTGFRGVLNSTTNHILSALEDGEAFAPALARMQAAGIAEADPSLDVDGWDAAAKTAALANVLMDAGITPHAVARTGIGPGTAAAAQAALAQGARLRLVASAARTAAGVVEASVRPTALPAGDLLAGLRGTANALVLHTDLLGDLAIHQLGGGLGMTAYALLSDLLTIRRRAS
jgi:homoserine dehydrogenase